MGKSKNLSEFDKEQIVMTGQLSQSIFKMTSLVGCSWYAVVNAYQKWTKEGQQVN